MRPSFVSVSLKSQSKQSAAAEDEGEASSTSDSSGDFIQLQAFVLKIKENVPQTTRDPQYNKGWFQINISLTDKHQGVRLVVSGKVQNAQTCKMSDKHTHVGPEWDAFCGTVKCERSTYFVAKSMFFLWTCSFGSEC